MKEQLNGMSQIILELIKNEDKGILGITEILKGSRSKSIMNRGLYQSKWFGAFFWLHKDNIKGIIRQLKQLGFIESYDWGGKIGAPYFIPKLRLTAAGKRALEQKMDIPLFIDKDIPDIQSSDTITTTIGLFRIHHSVPEVAYRRKFAYSTIWKHLEMGIKLRLIPVEEIVPQDTLDQVRRVKVANPTKSLSELKMLLPEDLDWGMLRCALAQPQTQDNK